MITGSDGPKVQRAIGSQGALCASQIIDDGGEDEVEVARKYAVVPVRSITGRLGCDVARSAQEG